MHDSTMDTQYLRNVANIFYLHLSEMVVEMFHATMKMKFIDYLLGTDLQKDVEKFHAELSDDMLRAMLPDDQEAMNSELEECEARVNRLEGISEMLVQLEECLRRLKPSSLRDVWRGTSPLQPENSISSTT